MMYNKHAMSALMSTLTFGILATVSGYALQYACKNYDNLGCKVTPIDITQVQSMVQGADVGMSIAGTSYIVVAYIVLMMLLLFYVIYSSSKYTDRHDAMRRAKKEEVAKEVAAEAAANAAADIAAKAATTATSQIVTKAVAKNAAKKAADDATENFYHYH